MDASSPQVVLLTVLNYHRLSQKCIGSKKFDPVSITLSGRDYFRTCFDKSKVWVLTTTPLQCGTVVLIRTLPGALNKLILQVTLQPALPLNWIHLKINGPAAIRIIGLW